jgi:tetratricopeptide (TPR) repeat protein
MKQKVLAMMVTLAGTAAFVSMLGAQDKQPPTVALPSKGKGMSDKERAAVKKVQDAKSPDEVIAAVENLVTNFADTSVKPAALYEAAEAADQKQDFLKAISYGELSIEADPKAGTAMSAKLLVAGELAQHTRKNDLDRESAEKLPKAEKYAKEAMEMLPGLAKPDGSNVPDAEWDTFKKDKMAEGHRDLGLIAVARAKWDVAVTEFKAAVDGSSMPDSVLMVRLGNAYNESNKFAEADAVLKKVLAMSDLNPSVKAFADQEETRAKRGLAGK